MNGIKKIDPIHKGIQISVIVHLLAIFAVISFNNYIPASKIMQIDFRMENAGGISKKDTEPSPKLKKQEINRTIQKEEVVQPQAIDAEKVIQKSTISSALLENQSPVSAPVVHQESNNSLSSVKAVVSTHADPAPAGISVESVKQRYLKEHFNYIRDLIQNKLTYPRIARKMGWTGKVVISFVISTDGNVKDINITEGSGFEMLDKNTIETVKKTSPFPRPPVEAQLLIPVTYKLN